MQCAKKFHLIKNTKTCFSFIKHFIFKNTLYTHFNEALFKHFYFNYEFFVLKECFFARITKEPDFMEPMKNVYLN